MLVIHLFLSNFPRFVFHCNMRLALYSVTNYSGAPELSVLSLVSSPFSFISYSHHRSLPLFSTRAVTSNEAQLCVRACAFPRVCVCVYTPTCLSLCLLLMCVCVLR